MFQRGNVPEIPGLVGELLGSVPEIPGIVLEASKMIQPILVQRCLNVHLESKSVINIEYWDSSCSGAPSSLCLDSASECEAKITTIHL